MKQPFYHDEAITIWCGDALAELKRMASESVHCIITSPPFWGLRDYKISGQIGLERQIGEYIRRLAEVFEEARRVLRKDGTLWMEIGDTWISTSGAGRQGKTGQREGRRHTQEATGVQLVAGTPRGGMKGPQKGRGARVAAMGKHSHLVGHEEFVGSHRLHPQPGLKAKDMAGIPWRMAFALQDAGWYLRQENIWHKPNATPESAPDRPSTAHTKVFLFAKSRRNYYDQEAVKEPVTGNAHPRSSRSAAAKEFPGDAMHDGNRRRPGVGPKAIYHSLNWARGHGDHTAAGFTAGRVKNNGSFAAAVVGLVEMRKLRSVWTIPTSKFSEAHFATFPPRLAELCIKAGTSERGCCAKCGAPWKRILKKPEFARMPDASPKFKDRSTASRLAQLRQAARAEGHEYTSAAETIGWQPTCKCGCADVAPCKVLDPFLGAGTVLLVAKNLNRLGVGIELNPDYCAMARRRILTPLFETAVVAEAKTPASPAPPTLFDLSPTAQPLAAAMP